MASRRKLLSRRKIFEKDKKKVKPKKAKPSWDLLVPQKKITDFEQMVALEYIVDFNKSDAYKRAMKIKSRDSFHEEGAAILDKHYVQKYVEKLRTDLIGTREDTIAQLYRESKRLAFYNVDDFFNEEGELKDFKDLSRDALAAIETIEVTQSLDKLGNPVTTKKIKLANKHKALEMLFKVYQLYDTEIKIDQDTLSLMLKKISNQSLGPPCDRTDQS